VRQIALGTFDNFNVVVSGVKGSLANGITLIHETLTTPALDEVSTEYGLLAEAVSYPADRASVTYRLRANARWHDGKPIAPDDVIFSLNTFKNNSPQLAAYYRHVTKAEKSGERDVTFTFDAPGNRELPQIVGQLTVLPQHWWEGTDAQGRKRDVKQTTLEPPTIGAKASTSASVATISSSFATNIIAIPRLLLKPSRLTRSIGAPRTAQKTGRPPTIFPASTTSAWCWRNFRSAISASCRRSPSTSGARSSAIRACGAPSTTPSISRR
jgi:hypothetical protein